MAILAATRIGGRVSRGNLLEQTYRVTVGAAQGTEWFVTDFSVISHVIGATLDTNGAVAGAGFVFTRNNTGGTAAVSVANGQLSLESSVAGTADVTVAGSP